MYKMNQLYNVDCMEALKDIPDNFFELAIVDPPYGIGLDMVYKNNLHNNIERN